MLALTREQLVDHLQRVPGLVDRNVRHDPDYAARVVAWMSDVEATLARLRSPLSSLVAAQRARIVAVDDGWRDPDILRERINARKAERATASMALGQVEEALRAEVERIDVKFEEMRQRIAQLLAVASATSPIPLPPTEPRRLWLDRVWSSLAVNGETTSLYAFINAALTPVDRTYLLDEMMTNLVGAGGTSLGSLGFVAPEAVARLSATGIDTAEELVAVASNASGRRDVMKRADVDIRTVRSWLKRIDLMRVDGVDAAQAELLVRSGVDSVRELRRRNPQSLARKLAEVNRGLVADVPGADTTDAWVRAARGL